MEIGEYHESKGWYFKRLDDGSVRIRHEDQTSAIAHVIQPGPWASIVAFVSKDGETSETFQEACAFHGDPHVTRVEVDGQPVDIRATDVTAAQILAMAAKSPDHRLFFRGTFDEGDMEVPVAAGFSFRLRPGMQFRTEARRRHD